MAFFIIKSLQENYSFDEKRVWTILSRQVGSILLTMLKRKHGLTRLQREILWNERVESKKCSGRRMVKPELWETHGNERVEWRNILVDAYWNSWVDAGSVPVDAKLVKMSPGEPGNARAEWVTCIGRPLSTATCFFWKIMQVEIKKKIGNVFGCCCWITKEQETWKIDITLSSSSSSSLRSQTIIHNNLSFWFTHYLILIRFRSRN